MKLLQLGVLSTTAAGLADSVLRRAAGRAAVAAGIPVSAPGSLVARHRPAQKDLLNVGQAPPVHMGLGNGLTQRAWGDAVSRGKRAPVAGLLGMV